MSRNRNSNIVYSTDQGRMCPGCGWPVKQCACSKQKAIPKGDGIVRVGRQTKGRKGKGVTTISGVPLDADGLASLAKELKKQCGSGGTVRENVIEIQGDHREKIVEELKKQGYTVKLAGG